MIFLIGFCLFFGGSFVLTSMYEEYGDDFISNISIVSTIIGFGMMVYSIIATIHSQGVFDVLMAAFRYFIHNVV